MLHRVCATVCTLTPTPVPISPPHKRVPFHSLNYRAPPQNLVSLDSSTHISSSAVTVCFFLVQPFRPSFLFPFRGNSQQRHVTPADPLHLILYMRKGKNRFSKGHPEAEGSVCLCVRQKYTCLTICLSVNVSVVSVCLKSRLTSPVSQAISLKNKQPLKTNGCVSFNMTVLTT